MENKMLGPFKVASVGSNHRYCKLELPDSGKIHPMFNNDFLERYKGTDPKQQVVELEADREDWETESILASGPSDGNPKQHVILVKWKGFLQKENMWETYANVAEHHMGLLEEYYERNPTRG
jgi:hypothetical protein